MIDFINIDIQVFEFLNDESFIDENLYIKDNFEEYKFEPHITDIAIPYVLFKRKNENYFFVIKEKDTLKFKLEID